MGEFKKITKTFNFENCKRQKVSKIKKKHNIKVSDCSNFNSVQCKKDV